MMYYELDFFKLIELSRQKQSMQKPTNKNLKKH